MGNGNVGIINKGYLYSISSNSGANGLYYNVLLQYSDLANDQSYSDPTNCIDYRIYSTQNNYLINPARKYNGNGADGNVPTWPVSRFSYNYTNEAG